MTLILSPYSHKKWLSEPPEMCFFEVNVQTRSVTGTKRRLKWSRRGSPHVESTAVSFWGSHLLTSCTYCRSACSMLWYRSPPATPERAGERSTLKSDTASFCLLYLYQHFILFFVFFFCHKFSLCNLLIFFHSYFSPPAAFSVSTSLNMCVTLLWLENPQIPAATSMANMISRKKKNCTVDKTKWHSADGVDAWLHAAVYTCPTLAHVSM